MPDEEPWLSLKISVKDPLGVQKKTLLSGERSRGAFFISVPKRLVPLSTRRNRIRRLIREAARQDPFFLAAGALYEFKVTSAPRDPGLEKVKAVLENIKTGSGKGFC